MKTLLNDIPFMGRCLLRVQMTYHFDSTWIPSLLYREYYGYVVHPLQHLLCISPNLPFTLCRVISMSWSRRYKATSPESCFMLPLKGAIFAMSTMLTNRHGYDYND